MEVEKKRYSFDYAAVKIAMMLDEFINIIFFQAYGFKVERIGPPLILFPDYWLVAVDHPAKRIKTNMLELIHLRSLVISETMKQPATDQDGSI